MSPWLAVTALIVVVGALTYVHGVRAQWSRAQTSPAGTISTAELHLAENGTPTFTVANEPVDPATQTVCVGDALTIAIPLRATATGTTMTPVLTRTTTQSLPASIALDDVNLADINADLGPSSEAQQLLVEVAVTAGAPGRASLSSDFTLAASPTGLWTSSVTSLGAVTVEFVDCLGKIVTTWDTRLVPDGPHARMTVGA